MAVRLILEHALTPNGWSDGLFVHFEEGRFAEVRPSTPEDRATATFVAGFVVPGVGNVHSHAFQRGFAGLTERRGAGTDDHFWTWREAMYRFASEIEPDDLTAIAAFGQVEMLESGFTGVAEFHYLHHPGDGGEYDDPAEMSGAVVKAADATGIGMTLLPVLYSHGGFADRPCSEGQRRFASDLDRFERLHEAASRHVAGLPGGRIGVAPHSLRAVALRELRSLADRHRGAPIHIHIAEQTAEVDDCLAATGSRPVDLLMDNVGVDGDWCLVHATHVTQTEVERMASSGAVVGLCPITEADLGDGIFPAVDLIENGGRLGVGSDSNVLISLPQELRLLEQSQRLRDRRRNRMALPPRSTGRTLLDLACSGGARALGIDGGRIAVGCVADLVVLDAEHPAMVGRTFDAALDAWIFASATNPVREVWSRGRRVVAEGIHVARETVERDWRRVLAKLSGR